MKFLCDNCKAKYQIADEKVAGRTVRMKCRKCSHLIEIRASVTETSVALSTPAGPPAPGEGTMQVSLDALAAPRPATRTGLAGASAPRAPRPVTGASGGIGFGAAAAAPRAEASGSGLAGAFSESMRSEAAPAFEESPTHALDMAAGGVTEEWYVGINGVPVGPVRLTEFRAKIQSGAVNGESLVWRDGFEEWLPLRNFPELMEILRTATQNEWSSPSSGRSGSVAPRPLTAIASNALRSKSSGSLNAVAPAAAHSGPSSQGQASAPASRGNVIAFGKAATAEKLDFEPAPAAADPFAPPVSDPFAAPVPVSAPVPASVSVPVSDPFAPPPGSPFATAAGPAGYVPVAANFATPSIPPPAPSVDAPRRSGGIPVAAWFAIAAALGAGLAGGSLLAGKEPPPPTVQIVTVSAVAPVAPVPTETATARPDTSVAVVAPSATATAKVAVKNPGTSTPEKTAEPATPAVGAVPAVGGVPAIGAVGGPTTGPGGPNPGGGGGEKLTGDQISAVVNGGRNALKRACWEPALAARGPNGPSSARVVVALVIGPDGRVQSASPSGGDGFPTLASCIGSRVRSWSFPQSQSTTQTAPAFNFVAQ